MHGQVGFGTPCQHLAIIFGERVAAVHQQDQAAQRLADAQILREVILPPVFHRQWDFCVAIAGQVDQAAIIAQIKEIYLLGASWCFTGTSQAALGGDTVEGAGLSGIGAPGKSDLGTAIGWRETGFGDTGKEAGTLKLDSHNAIFSQIKQVYWLTGRWSTGIQMGSFLGSLALAHPQSLQSILGD